MKGKPWSIEEDRIVLDNTDTKDCVEELREHGYHRTGQAVLSRRKALMRVKGKSPEALATERAELEADLKATEKHLRDIKKRLVEIRVEQVRDATGDIDLPEEVYRKIRESLEVS